MKNDNLNVILTDLAEHAKPAAQIDLWPTLKENLATSDGQPNKGKPIMNPNPVLSRAALAALALILVFAILLASPQGQAFAQELLKYFTTTSQKWLPAWPMPAPVPTYALEVEAVPQPSSLDMPDCGPVISPISSTFLCQLNDAQSKLGFIIKSFPAEYVDATFHVMEIDLENKAIRLSFLGEDASYSIAQGLGDFPVETMGYAVHQDAIQLTQVGKYPAEYAAGSFIFSEDTSMTWDPTSPRYQLRWKEAGYWYSVGMSLYGLSPQSIGLTPAGVKEKMIMIAENLVTLEQGPDRLTAGRQPSIKDRAGFNVKEPGLLPKNFHQVSDGSWSLLIPNKVDMMYEYTENGKAVGSLQFSQIPLPANEETLRWEFSQFYHGDPGETDFIVDEEVQINGRVGHYLVPAGEFSPYALYWQDDEREYILICFWSLEFGGRLSKEDLIVIAENLR
ncbi:MAG: hypothetical protein CVU44_22490 [Chloroflexi bacterium HGW-Chloroflexi-6]|nr:MAG: hypothetical protein CVU44_22490 [Chloroflexi bacterium HGW-Chloroflexi-6]